METAIKKQGNRVWIYCRVNCPDNTALRLQQEQMIEFATKQGLAVIGITAEQESGLDFNRAGLKEVMKAVETEQIGIILTKSICRIGRSMPLVMACIDKLEEHGVKLVTADDGEVNFGPLRVAIYCRVGSKKQLR